MTRPKSPESHDDDLRIKGGPIDVGEGGGQTKPTDPGAFDPGPPPEGMKHVELLGLDRVEPGTLATIPEGEYGFAVTIDHVLYVHVSDRARDGLPQFIPFSAK